MAHGGLPIGALVEDQTRTCLLQGGRRKRIGAISPTADKMGKASANSHSKVEDERKAAANAKAILGWLTPSNAQH